MSQTFKKICKMSQETLKEYVAEQLKQTHEEIIIDDGYVYAQGSFPVLLVAHMDTVHSKLPEMIVYDPKKQSLSSPQGIGGDDRCGIFMVLEVIRRYNCSVLFCEDEEIGCLGAHKFTESKLARSLEFNYIIEFDRKGSNDAVFYDCDNIEFEDFITKEFFKTAWGSFSDISVLAPVLGCAAVNLSCGYYNAHTKTEYVVMPEMKNIINKACKILERTTEDDKFEYIESKYSWNKYGYDSFFDDYMDDYDSIRNMYYMFEFVDEHDEVQWWETLAINEEEAVGIFAMSHPDIPYINILDVCCESFVRGGVSSAV